MCFFLVCPTENEPDGFVNSGPLLIFASKQNMFHFPHYSRLSHVEAPYAAGAWSAADDEITADGPFIGHTYNTVGFFIQ